MNAAAERWVFFAVFFVLIFLAFGLVKEVINRRQVDIRINEYKGKISSLEQDNSVLSDKIANFSDSGELEGSVRAKLAMEKPGEHTIIIVRQDSKDKATVKTSQQVIEFDPDKFDDSYASNPQKWWNYFFAK